METIYQVDDLDEWGDYGGILRGGLTMPGGLKRCGPFVPPISFIAGCPGSDGEVVLTERFLDRHRKLFSSLVVDEIRRIRCINLAWERWLGQDWVEGPTHGDGEPEAFLDGPHDRAARRGLGRLFRLRPHPRGGRMRMELTEDEDTILTIIQPPIPARPVFTDRRLGKLFVTPAATTLLADPDFRRWTRLTPVQVVDRPTMDRLMAKKD
jgi:hypothetical protein